MDEAEPKNDCRPVQILAVERLSEAAPLRYDNPPENVVEAPE